MTTDSLGRVEQAKDLISDYWTGKVENKEKKIKPTEFLKHIAQLNLGCQNAKNMMFNLCLL